MTFMEKKEGKEGGSEEEGERKEEGLLWHYIHSHNGSKFIISHIFYQFTNHIHTTLLRGCE